ncbi:MaoC family dehydratase [Umboniibacter marinipuniceus]|uniref:Acyl dehydratase n=1 Tax=Umboniibacter marinipuniceus TaxID=569599 RepID=A0A3M0AUA1_9GAMM|nr:MaoC family dehydratase [Umboniibacter marinipuniceus]RMA82532.1 acyl dehydratase [Umboniibacter marinipuniceus]
MTITIHPSKLPEYIGKETGVSEWMTVTQEQVDQFADATHDHQFIHVDPEAAAKTPFGGTIAHGFLSLSLLSAISYQTGILLEGMAMGLNYGFEKVRFLSPVKVGSRVRGRSVLADVVEKRPGQFLYTWDVTVEIEGEERPALKAEWLTMTIVETAN